MKLTIEDITNTVLEVLGETKLKSLDHVYEKHGDQLKLIMSFHNLNLIHDVLIHTKLIFNVDDEKIYLSHNQLTYLYDLNCSYKMLMFEDDEDLKEQLTEIFFDFLFGEDISQLSTFIASPSRMVNEYLNSIDFNKTSVLTVDYQPKFNIVECSSYTADFNIEMINDYKFDLSIKKVEDSHYEFTFKINDKYIKKETNTLVNSIPAIIGEMIKTNFE
jgi:hypothetical protein